MNKSETGGLIIDFRTNLGGNMFLSNRGLEMLFNTSVSTIGFASRSDPDDHSAMRSAASPGEYVIRGKFDHYPGKPIAVLTGPGARSSGDQVALRMTFHPKPRVFGKPTTASFNAPAVLEFRNHPWSSAYAEADAYLVTRPNHYLTHDELKVDEKVWLTPEDVARGRGTVVEAAIEWIHGRTTTVPRPGVDIHTAGFSLGQNYPNPFNLTTAIPFFLQRHSSVCVQIFDVRGREVAQVMDEELCPGEYRIRFDARGLPGGIYFYRVEAGRFIRIKRMVVLK
ncbi:T9SS type A sorting domain-containing protein [bacterium]|nr:T9SS type A sorting domain-containing protein [bacterium]